LPTYGGGEKCTNYVLLETENETMTVLILVDQKELLSQWNY